MLFRAMYFTDDTWLRRVSAWAGPITRLQFQSRATPSVQGFGLVELGDSVLIVIPGTSSEVEAIAYLLTHALDNTASTFDGEWSMNSTWVNRGAQVERGYRFWPPPTTRKPIIVVGHSSGGAYGAFTAFTVDNDVNFLTTLVTYGAPIWGTPSMERRYREHFTQGDRIQTGVLRPQVVEFGNPNDFVTALPPPWSLIDVVIPGYPRANRPTYTRFVNLLQLGANGAPTPVNQPTTTETATSALLTILTGQGLGAQHAPAAYTANAERWADNDPTIADAGWGAERTALKNILVDMNAAGVGV